MTILDDLKESIEKNLPAEVSKRLQERLKLADGVNSLKEDNERLNRIIEDLQKEITKHRKLTDRENELRNDERKLKQRSSQLELDKQLSEQKIQFTEQRRYDTMRTLEMILANRVIRESITDNIVLQNPDREAYGQDCPTAIGQGEVTQQVTNTKETEEG
jgi:hypothetical protein|tara:strand:- start:62 stop:541 length:480 start_codon:yes stop_codon:yes gene_type:complete